MVLVNQETENHRGDDKTPEETQSLDVVVEGGSLSEDAVDVSIEVLKVPVHKPGLFPEGPDGR